MSSSRSAIAPGGPAAKQATHNEGRSKSKSSKPSSSSSSSGSKYRFYPAATFSASPTYNTWARLTCADVHALRAPSPTWKSQGIFFHLNHPIRFVRVVGVVVAHTQAYERLHILTLDDGSGATLDVRIPHEPFPAPTQRKSQGQAPDEDNEDDEDSVGYPSGRQQHQRPGQARPQDTIIHPTSIPNIQLRTTPTEPLPTLHIFNRPQPPPPTISISAASNNNTNSSALRKPNTTTPSATPLTEGTTLKLKGTLSLFRSTLQLDLRRASLVRSTSEEMQCWTEVAEFADIIMKPWVLGDAEVRRLERRALEGATARKRRERARARTKWKARRVMERDDVGVEQETEVERQERLELDGAALDRRQPRVESGSSSELESELESSPDQD